MALQIIPYWMSGFYKVRLLKWVSMKCRLPRVNEGQFPGGAAHEIREGGKVRIMMNSPRRRARQSRRRLQLTKTRARRMDDGRTVAKTVSGGYLAGQTDRQTDRRAFWEESSPLFHHEWGALFGKPLQFAMKTQLQKRAMR